MDDDEQARRAIAREKYIGQRLADDLPAELKMMSQYNARRAKYEMTGWRHREEKALGDYMDAHGRWSARTTRRGNTELVWKGQDSQGRDREMVWMRLKGRGHSVDKMRNWRELQNDGKTTVLKNNYVERFAEGFRMIMDRPSGDEMTLDERTAADRLDRMRGVYGRSWDARTRPGSDEGDKNASGGQSQRNQEVRSSATPKTAPIDYGGWADRIGRGGEDERRAKLLYRLGVGREEWDSAKSLEQRKAIFQRQLYGKGFMSDDFASGAKALADYFREKAEDAGGSGFVEGGPTADRFREQGRQASRFRDRADYWNRIAAGAGRSGGDSIARSVAWDHYRRNWLDKYRGV